MFKFSKSIFVGYPYQYDTDSASYYRDNPDFHKTITANIIFFLDKESAHKLLQGDFIFHDGKFFYCPKYTARNIWLSLRDNDGAHIIGLSDTMRLWISTPDNADYLFKSYPLKLVD